MRVIGASGENLGILKRDDALALVRPEEGIDLIEIASAAKPPVARLMSFDKYRYLQQKAAKKEQLAKKTPGFKQIQISARAAKNDLSIKVRKLEEFLKEGYQIEISMRLRGAEKYNKGWARQKLDDFMKMITSEHKVIGEPKFGGRGMLARISKK